MTHRPSPTGRGIIGARDERPSDNAADRVVCFRVELAIHNLEVYSWMKFGWHSSVVNDSTSTVVSCQSHILNLQYASTDTSSNPQHVRYVKLRSYVSRSSSFAFTDHQSLSGLVRFIPKSGTSAVIGEPSDPSQDVGLAAYNAEPIKVSVFSGKSVLSPGEKTGETVEVEKLLSPLAEEEVGTIRCIGLNVSLFDFSSGSRLSMIRLAVCQSRS